jgi:O-Antigen ligase
LETHFVDETVVSPVARRTRLPRLGIPSLPKWRLSRSADSADRPLIAAYKRPALGPVAIGVWLALLGVACGVYGWLFAFNAPQLMLPFAIPPVVFALLLIWSLPAGDYAPTRTLGALFWAFFAAFILWPNYLAIALPGLPWLTLVRIINAPLFVALLICVSVSRPFRTRIAECLKDSPFIWKSLALYIGIATVTLPLAGASIPFAINKFVVLMTTEIATFFLGAYIFLRPGRLEIWVYLLLAMDALLCAVGWWENRLGYVPWVGHIPSFLKIDDPTVNRVLAGFVRAAIDVHRVQSVQTTPLGFAELLGLSSPLALHLAINRYPFVIRVGATAMIPIIIYTIMLTDSRLGYIAMIIGGALYLLLWALVRWREVRGSLFGPAIVMGYPAIFVAILASTLLVHRIRAKVWGDGSQSSSDESRKDQWHMAIPKLTHNPIGHGYGTAGDVLGYTNLDGIPTVDSYYINLLLDTGILGFAIYLAFFLGSAWLAAREVMRVPGERELRMLMPLSVTLVGFVVVKGVLSQDANHPLVYFFVGAIAALIHRSRARQRELAADGANA